MLCAGKVVFVKAVGIGEVEPARNWEVHRSAGNLDDWAGGNSQSEKQRGQQGRSGKHLRARNVRSSETEWRIIKLGWLLCVRCTWFAHRIAAGDIGGGVVELMVIAVLPERHVLLLGSL